MRKKEKEEGKRKDEEDEIFLKLMKIVNTKYGIVN